MLLMQGRFIELTHIKRQGTKTLPGATGTKLREAITAYNFPDGDSNGEFLHRVFPAKNGTRCTDSSFLLTE